MSARQVRDRNSVNIGPARVKVDDSIYDAVDQGVVGTTNVTTTTPDTGFTPIGPIGDLITPPVLDPVTGYPITAAAINFTESALSAVTAWAVLDLSSIGSFANALIVGSDSTGSAAMSFVNLDNPSQKTTYIGKNREQPVDFILRDGYITHALDAFISGVWANPSYTLDTSGGGTIVKTATELQTPYTEGVKDELLAYFAVQSGASLYHYYAQPHVGSLGPVYFASSTNGSGQAPVAITGSILWCACSNGVFAIDTDTGAVSSNVAVGSSFNSGIYWGLTTGALAGLKQTTVGSTVVYDLTIVGTDGGLTVQPALMTLPDTHAFQVSVPVPGADITLVVFYDVVDTVEYVYQVSTAGYQPVTMPTDRVRGLRISNANPSGFIRWWGSDAAGTGDALYEAAL